MTNARKMAQNDVEVAVPLGVGRRNRVELAHPLVVAVRRGATKCAKGCAREVPKMMSKLPRQCAWHGG